MRTQTSYLVLLCALFAPQSQACGGGGSSFKEWLDVTFSVKTAYSVGTAVTNSGSRVMGPINSMLFTAAEFFSSRENVENFGKGVKAVRDYAEVKGSTGVGGMGYRANAGMSKEEFASLLR